MKYNHPKSRAQAIQEYGQELIEALDKLPKSDNPHMDNIYHARCGNLLATYILPDNLSYEYYQGAKKIDWADYWDGYYY